MTENLACTELIFLCAIFSAPNQSPPEANQNKIITRIVFSMHSIFYTSSKNINSIGRPSGSWNCKSRMTSFTSAITLRAAIVSSLQSMHLLMGTIRREIEYNFLIMLSSPSLPNHHKNVFTLLSPLLNDSLLWVLHSFEQLTLLSGPLSWALYWVTNSFEHSF